MTTLAVLQPGYLPWLGYFDQVRRADVFVHYDDVQFDRGGWRNRNRVKSPQGPQWLTVPVRYDGDTPARICEVEIDQRAPWARKHIATIRHLYARAPHLDDYLPEIGALLERGWGRLVDLDLAVVERFCGWLGVSARFARSSELGIEGERSERLLRICQHFGASRYLSGSAARDYLDLDLFACSGIAVEWQDYHHPTYPQLHGEFVPYLSALDLLLNNGPTSGAILASGNPA